VTNSQLGCSFHPDRSLNGLRIRLSSGPFVGFRTPKLRWDRRLSSTTEVAAQTLHYGAAAGSAPTAAQRQVEDDEVGRYGSRSVGQQKLVLLEGSFGVEHVDIVAYAGGVALASQIDGLAVVRDRLYQRGSTELVGAVGSQRVVDSVP